MEVARPVRRGGPGKPTSRKAGRAPRSDPYTEHPTRGGTVYLAVVLDAWNREVIGWSIANHIRAEIVCDALEQALWARNPKPGTDPLVHHSDAGTQYLSIRYTDRMVETGISPSVGSVGDSYDNALAESVIGLYKTELIRNKGP